MSASDRLSQFGLAWDLSVLDLIREHAMRDRVVLEPLGGAAQGSRDNAGVGRPTTLVTANKDAYQDLGPIEPMIELRGRSSRAEGTPSA
jgi:hypothetical protein